MIYMTQSSVTVTAATDIQPFSAIRSENKFNIFNKDNTPVSGTTAAP